MEPGYAPVCGRERGERPYAVRSDADGRVRLTCPGPDTVFDHRTLGELAT
ncbi:DUF1918 domain-containing protein [Lentzea roselyniae]